MQQSERPSLRRVRARLALRLSLQALVGLAAVFALLAALLVLAGWLFWQGCMADGLGSLALWWAVSALAALAAWRVFDLLCVSAPAPHGIRLPEDGAEALHYRIKEVGRRLGVPRLDGVWITDEMNAAVLQRPSMGCMGRIETHLMIGLPLAHCLSRRQFLAVLAHEFGHLVAQRRGMGARGTHLRAWWLRVADRAAERFPVLEAMVDRSLRHYTLSMLRLSRLEEFEADAIAARLVGRSLLGDALLEVSAKDRFLREDYWPKVLAQCMNTPAPRIRPFREMGLGVAAGFYVPDGLNPGFCGGWDNEGGGLLHPSPRERLRALRVQPGDSATVGPSAASHYLADLLPRLAWAFDRDWWGQSAGAWRDAYREARRTGEYDDPDSPTRSY